MTNTIMKLVDNFNSKAEVDWGLLGIIADAYREEGDELLADYLQTCCKYKKYITSTITELELRSYYFFYINSGFCREIPTHLLPLQFTMFGEKFLYYYVHGILVFKELKRINRNIVLPDYCLTLTSKMFPGYDGKGKTLGQIKKELSNV